MNKLVTVTVFVITGLGVASAAHAQAPPAPERPVQEIFKRADTNNDGDVSFEELSAAIPSLTREKFDKMDRNSDGVLNPADQGRGRPQPRQRGGFGQRLREADKDGNGDVTPEEMQAAFPTLTKEHFDRFDTNDDGVISDADTKARRKGPSRGGSAIFQRLGQADKDGDGRVTFDEIKTIAPDMTEERFKQMDRDGDGALTRADRPPDRPSRDRVLPPVFAKLGQSDKDGDGKVTLEELTVAMPGMTQQRFQQLDRNNDGVLTEDDAPKTVTPAGRSVRPDGNRAAQLARLLREADTNGDDQVTYEEMVAARPGFPRKAFDRLDTDHNGLLTATDRPQPTGASPETRPARQGQGRGGRSPMVSRLRRADANSDGQITREEVQTALPNMPAALFDRFDSNGDGAIAADELPPQSTVAP